MHPESPPTTHLSGYPRIGEQRELKRATEAYWKGELTRPELEALGRDLRARNWQKQTEAGIDLVACNDFSFYDQMLDLSCLLGNVPPRFGSNGAPIDLDTTFLVARGTRGAQSLHRCECHSSEAAPFASEMTKWFDTNYHYIVPEFRADTEFRVSTNKIFEEFAEARALGLKAKPVLIGPITYLALGKEQDPQNPAFDRFKLLDRLVPVYEEILHRLASDGAEWIQFDEPVLALDLTAAQRSRFRPAYARLAAAAGKTRLIVATYFGELGDNRSTFLDLPVDGLHVDAVRGRQEVDVLLREFPTDKILSLGVVDGRNVWKNDFAASLQLLEQAQAKLGLDRLWIAPSCSLLHSPLTLENEADLDPELRNWLAFADEKLREVSFLRDFLAGAAPASLLADNSAAIRSRRLSRRIHNDAVRQRVAGIRAADTRRATPFPERQSQQREKLGFPAFPTTTIGSFPQTREVRANRAQLRRGAISAEAHDAFLETEIRRCVEFQDRIGIDMPVHGEFERNDMVEYFGEQLEGFAFTRNGWVQSYGTRYVKPPIIYGDVSRPHPMTTRWSAYAQSLTSRPMKGMLTGPITILQWSFVRDDQARAETARQIALAIRDEVLDLEKIGLAAIQIDEPALREGLPLRSRDWAAYLDWAVAAFRLTSSGVRNDTQIHTHMCYAEFNDIIEAIAALDADVITIETSRSRMELLDAFVAFEYPNEIGPGVYDIHSPRVPSIEDMISLMRTAAHVIPPAALWVNPDCGLKTRQWPEVEASLENMVRAAQELRRIHTPGTKVPPSP